MKYSDRFRPEFTKSLTIAEELIGKRTTKFVVCRVDRKQISEDGIEIIPYQDFLSEVLPSL